jgi:hypothetical protein
MKFHGWVKILGLPAILLHASIASKQKLMVFDMSFHIITIRKLCFLIVFS